MKINSVMFYMCENIWIEFWGETRGILIWRTQKLSCVLICCSGRSLISCTRRTWCYPPPSTCPLNHQLTTGAGTLCSNREHWASRIGFFFFFPVSCSAAAMFLTKRLLAGLMMRSKWMPTAAGSKISICRSVEKLQLNIAKALLQGFMQN